MGGSNVFIPRGQKLGEGYTKAERFVGQEVKPLHGGKIAQGRASWLDDLIALRKVVILCTFCRAVFKPHKVGYRRVFIPDTSGKSDGYQVNGCCDWCKNETANIPGGGTAFQPEELYKATTIDPSQARRSARAAAKSLRTWQYLQSKQSRR